METIANNFRRAESIEQGQLPPDEMRFETKRHDLLRRFTPTPYAANLVIMGKTVRLETNLPRMVEKTLEFFARYQGASAGALEFGAPEFLWRIVGQSGSQEDSAAVELSAFSDDGLSFVNIGHRGFLAVDHQAREAVGFVDEVSVESEPELQCRPVFDTLFSICAGSLGKVALAAACVGQGTRGILILGPPDSGKTTASYLAAGRGFEFHADQAVFLEMQEGRLHAWGDLLPAIFRPQALEFLPELRISTRRFSYPGFTVHYLSKRPFQTPKSHWVEPVGCIFLNRQAAAALQLIRLTGTEFRRRLEESLLFKDDHRFAVLRETAFQSLGSLPAYELVCPDPDAAASVVCDLLTYRPK